MKPSELYDLAKEVYRYINANPMVSRGILNTHFRTSSDDRRNRQLSEAIDALLARLYVFKYTDEGTTQTFFWTQEFKDSPYEPDDEPILDYTPVDIFNTRPVDEVPPPPPAPTPAPTPAPVGVVTDAPMLDENSPEFKAMQKMYERIGGKLKPVYEIMMREPTKIWGKADEAFSFLGDHVQRAMMLGRMFGLGYIRRFKDEKDPKISYYTIFGVCPASLIEDSVELGKAAQKRQKAAKEAQERKENMDRINANLAERKEQPQTPPVEDEQEEEQQEEQVEIEEVEETVEEETVEAVEDEDTDPPEAEEETVVEPACYVSNTGEIFIRRKDNTSIDLDVEESAAVLELFRMMNPAVLDQLVERVKAKKEPQ